MWGAPVTESVLSIRSPALFFKYAKCILPRCCSLRQSHAAVSIEKNTQTKYKAREGRQNHRKNKTLSKCWLNFGQALQTVNQPSNNIGNMTCVSWYTFIYYYFNLQCSQPDTVCYVGRTLGQQWFRVLWLPEKLYFELWFPRNQLFPPLFQWWCVIRSVHLIGSIKPHGNDDNSIRISLW